MRAGGRARYACLGEHLELSRLRDRIVELLKRGFECGEELLVVVGLVARGGDLLAQSVERRAVGRLCEVEHADYLAYLVTCELVVDRVQVLRLSMSRAAVGARTPGGGGGLGGA